RARRVGGGRGVGGRLGMTLVGGRGVTDADAKGAPRVAVVNETFARYFFKDQDPLGRRFGFGRKTEGDELPITIVGVVRDGKVASLKEPAKRYAYLPYTQQSDLGGMTFYARAGGAPDPLAARLRTIVPPAAATL